MPYVTCTKAIDDMPQYPGGALIAFAPGQAQFVHESVRHVYVGNPDFTITEQNPEIAAISEAVRQLSVSAPSVGALYARGTSYTNGAGATGENAYIKRLSDALGLTLQNGGLGGAVSATLAYQYAEGPQKWTPGVTSGVVSIECGINDALQETDATFVQFRRVFENTLIAAIRWHRGTRLVKPSSSEFVNDGAAVIQTFEPNSGVNLSPGLKLVGDGVGTTITPQIDDVSDVTLYVVPWRESGAAENGDFRYRLGAGPWQKATTLGMGDVRPDGSNIILSLMSVRIPNVTPGQAIRVEKLGASGKVWVYGYVSRTYTDPVPPIVLIQDVWLNTTGGQWATAGSTARQKNETLEHYRETLRRVAARPEFMSGVVVADANPTFDPASDLDPDKLHPNDSGHGKIYQAAMTALASN